MFFCGSGRQQNRQNLAVDISERGCQNGTKFCRKLEEGWCTPPPRLVTFGPQVPLRSQNIEGFKKFVMFSLRWFHEGRLYGVAGLKKFWWSLVHFFWRTNFRSWISRTLLIRLPQNFAWLWFWPMDISSPNLVNFDSGIRQCHAATCIIPSLMHLFLVSFLLLLPHG